MTNGFFLSYTLLKHYQKHSSYITVTMKIVRRFLRLWPIYLFCLFINWNILSLTDREPLWPILLNFPSKSCNSYLPHIFMVSNLFQDKCFNYLWLRLPALPYICSTPNHFHQIRTIQDLPISIQLYSVDSHYLCITVRFSIPLKIRQNHLQIIFSKLSFTYGTYNHS
jgi:hypothetical protein